MREGTHRMRLRGERGESASITTRNPKFRKTPLRVEIVYHTPQNRQARLAVGRLIFDVFKLLVLIFIGGCGALGVKVERGEQDEKRVEKREREGGSEEGGCVCMRMCVCMCVCVCMRMYVGVCVCEVHLGSVRVCVVCVCVCVQHT